MGGGGESHPSEFQWWNSHVNMAMAMAFRQAHTRTQVSQPRKGHASRRVARRDRRTSTCVAAGTGKFFVGGNWKCNGSHASVEKLVKDLNAGSVTANVDIVCAPPFVYLPQVLQSLKAPFQVGAQNCWVGKGGAFTGEVAAEMLVDLGINWVILGHSERRALCGENNEFVGEKVAYALEQGMSTIVCIGETLEQRENGTMITVLNDQLKAIAAKVSDWDRVVIAYEPVWAIGTGVVATPEQAQEVHAEVRKWLADNVSADVSSKMRILYGGSVNGKNCQELAGKEDIDGFLVGGASLKGEEFVAICNSASEKDAVGV